ncbi:MAG: SDR family oxidoreductase [candidate division Zixibacteria bacterium]|nr:SDR family oxidoreductase [candidate division Zixibacteria bacterium]
MDFGLKGKRALVCGASAGLGAAVAATLAAEGVELVINGRDYDRLVASATKIEKATGTKVGLAVGDVSIVADRVKIINATREHVREGVLDILVANSGGPPPGPFLEHSGDAWSQAGKLLLDSAVSLTRAFLPDMIEQKWGRLIYLTSVAVLQPMDELILSNAYRAGVTGFCKTVSNTYAKHGITANCVCPGYTATERLASLVKKRAEAAGVTPREAAQVLAADVPVGRVGKPEELAATVAFLASETAGYITGASIPVDGGLHRGLL